MRKPLTILAIISRIKSMPASTIMPIRCNRITTNRWMPIDTVQPLARRQRQIMLQQYNRWPSLRLRPQSQLLPPYVRSMAKFQSSNRRPNRSTHGLPIATTTISRCISNSITNRRRRRTMVNLVDCDPLIILAWVIFDFDTLVGLIVFSAQAFGSLIFWFAHFWFDLFLDRYFLVRSFSIRFFGSFYFGSLIFGSFFFRFYFLVRLFFVRELFQWESRAHFGLRPIVFF